MDKVFLDGKEVTIGSEMYYIGYGPVKVEKIFPDTIAAKPFNDGWVFTFYLDGTRYKNGDRALFWNKPEVTIPKVKTKAWKWIVKYFDTRHELLGGPYTEEYAHYRLSTGTWEWAHKIDETETEIEV